MALTTTDYVRPGATWPPRSEQARIANMRRWNDYYNGDYRLLTPNEDLRLRRNMFRLVANFWRDTLAGDPPRIAVNDRADEFIRMMMSSLLAATRSVVRDLVRYGCGVFYARRPGMIDTVDPRFWFPVTNAADVDDVRAHIVAYPFQSRPEEPRVPDRIKFYIIEGSSCTERVYAYTGGSLQAMIGEQSIVPCPPMPLVPVISDDDDPLFGVSVYPDIAPMVSDLHRRETLMSLALDNHSNPHLAVPEGSLTAGPTGRVEIDRAGLAIPVPEGAVMPAYVTWDPRMAEHRDALDRAVEAVLTHSGISTILYDPSIATGSVPSGAALRRLAMPTVQRVRVYRDALSHGLRHVLSAAGMLYGLSGMEMFSFTAEDVDVSWPSPLNTGFSDDSQAAVELVGAGVLTPMQARNVIEVEVEDDPDGERAQAQAMRTSQGGGQA